MTVQSQSSCSVLINIQLKCCPVINFHTLAESTSEMNITGTLPQAGNVKLFVPSLSTQGSTRLKQNIFNVVLMRSDKIE